LLVREREVSTSTMTGNNRELGWTGKEKKVCLEGKRRGFVRYIVYTRVISTYFSAFETTHVSIADGSAGLKCRCSQTEIKGI